MLKEPSQPVGEFNVPLHDPSRLYEKHREEIYRAQERVTKSGHFVLGQENEALEEELRNFLGVPSAVLVANGTDALEIALRSLGVTRGDLVVTVANAGGYGSSAVHGIGGFPIYVDVSKSDLQMSPRRLEECIRGAQRRPKAIIITHLYGKAAPILELLKVADLHGIPVLEDCAQSFGAMVGGKRLGTFGAMAVTSFYPTKNLAGFGDGGAIFSVNRDLGSTARKLRQYGWGSKYSVDVVGGKNSRMDELQAAWVRIMLPSLDDRNIRRRKIYERYREAASKSCSMNFPFSSAEGFVAHLGLATSECRSRVLMRLKDLGIGCDIHYPIPDHLQRGLPRVRGLSLPVTEGLAREVFSLPVFPELSEDEIEKVENAIRGS